MQELLRGLNCYIPFEHHQFTDSFEKRPALYAFIAQGLMAGLGFLKNYTIVYIGQTLDLSDRMQQHLSGSEQWQCAKNAGATSILISYVTLPPFFKDNEQREKYLKALEFELVAYYLPQCNKRFV